MRIIFQYDHEIFSNLQSDTNNHQKHQTKIVIDTDTNQYNLKQSSNIIQGGFKKSSHQKEMIDNKGLSMVEEESDEHQGSSVNDFLKEVSTIQKNSGQYSDVDNYSYGDMQLLKDINRHSLDKLNKNSPIIKDKFIDQLQKTMFKNKIKDVGVVLSLNEVIIDRSITYEKKYVEQFFRHYRATDLLTLYLQSQVQGLIKKQKKTHDNNVIIVDAQRDSDEQRDDEQQDDYYQQDSDYQQNDDQQQDSDDLKGFQQFIKEHILGDRIHLDE